MQYNIEEKLETYVKVLDNILNSNKVKIDNVSRLCLKNPDFDDVSSAGKAGDFDPITRPFMIDVPMQYWWYKMEFNVDQIDADTKAYFYIDMLQASLVNMMGRCGIKYWGGNRLIMNPAGYFMRPQGLVYINGELTSAVDVNHQSVEIDQNGHYTLYLYLFTDNFEVPTPIDFFVKYCNRHVEAAYFDYLCTLEAIELVNKSDPEYEKYISAINDAINIADFRTDGPELYESLRQSSAYLKKHVFEAFNDKSECYVNCVGHSHIDMAWLWDLEQTHNKAQRTFSTVLHLMKHYPNYRFIHTSPQLFEFLKADNPGLFARVKCAVEQGRFEVEGSSWIEPDCNLTSGESLVRQILYGKQFFADEFGRDCKILFLPDVFGYAFQLPQIMAKSGIENFVTAKIGWSDTNRFPMDAFMWQGLDGSQVFTYLISTCTANPRAGVHDTNGTSYNGNILAPEILGVWNRFQSKRYSDVVMTTYGYGDGGGGPTPQMLEKIDRYKHGLFGLGKTRFAGLGETVRTVRANFDAACEQTGETPTWNNEMYLEFHRGTYTSVPWVKYKNRKTEYLLQNAELLSSLAAVLCGEEYKTDTIERSYKAMLLNQFHDILPGSSIKKVYDDAAVAYKQIESDIEPIVDGAARAIAKRSNCKYVAINPNFFYADMPVFVDGKCYVVDSVPSAGMRAFALQAKSRTVVVGNKGNKTLENEYYKIEFDDAGQIVEFFDKQLGKQFVADGDAINKFVAYEDLPFKWDNWEISPYYKQKSYVIDGSAEFSKLDEGDRCGFKITRHYGDSTITQNVYLYEGCKRIDFVNHVEWSEKNQLVKVHFPLNLHPDQARFEVQFGSIGRNTVPQDSFDEAKFEVCGHKWADMSDGAVGIALLNDCKYGHSVLDNDIALTLFKDASYPNPDANESIPDFTFSLYPHTGDYRNSDIVQQACVLNRPAIVVENDCADDEPSCDNWNNSINSDSELSESFISSDCDGVLFETLKRAEDGNGYILRGYEHAGREHDVTIETILPVTSAQICDLQENEAANAKVELEQNKIKFHAKPWEIISIRLLVN